MFEHESGIPGNFVGKAKRGFAKLAAHGRQIDFLRFEKVCYFDMMPQPVAVPGARLPRRSRGTCTAAGIEFRSSSYSEQIRPLDIHNLRPLTESLEDRHVHNRAVWAADLAFVEDLRRCCLLTSTLATFPCTCLLLPAVRTISSAVPPAVPPSNGGATTQFGRGLLGSQEGDIHDRSPGCRSDEAMTVISKIVASAETT